MSSAGKTLLEPKHATVGERRLKRKDVTHRASPLAAVVVYLFVLVLGPPSRVDGRTGPRWTDERHLAPFAVYADFSLESHTRSLESLRTLPAELQQVLGISVSPRTIHIYLFRDAQTLLRYARSVGAGSTKRRALFVRQRDRLMVFAQNSPRLGVDLRHECTHALLHGVMPEIPLWLDEGLAEYFERGSAVAAEDDDLWRSIQAAMRQGTFRQVEQLETAVQMSDFTAQHYQQAWAWVHYLLRASPETRRVLQDYLRGLAAAPDPLPFSRHLARRLPFARAGVRDYFAMVQLRAKRR